MDRPWSKIARAIHGHGIPTITLDPVSTPYEIACQVVLKGYWHGYIGSDEPALANALAHAYPRQVERIQRVTHAPNRASAAATLLEQLIRPGFDPAQGAEATRRYVRRKASIAVMEHRKAGPGRYPWTQVGISERRYYKLLPQFAQKINGRYDLDHDDVVTRMKASPGPDRSQAGRSSSRPRRPPVARLRRGGCAPMAAAARLRRRSTRGHVVRDGSRAPRLETPCRLSARADRARRVIAARFRQAARETVIMTTGRTCPICGGSVPVVGRGSTASLVPPSVPLAARASPRPVPARRVRGHRARLVCPGPPLLRGLACPPAAAVPPCQGCSFMCPAPQGNAKSGSMCVSKVTGLAGGHP